MDPAAIIFDSLKDEFIYRLRGYFRKINYSVDVYVDQIDNLDLYVLSFSSEILYKFTYEQSQQFLWRIVKYLFSTDKIMQIAYITSNYINIVTEQKYSNPETVFVPSFIDI